MSVQTGIQVFFFLWFAPQAINASVYDAFKDINFIFILRQPHKLAALCLSEAACPQPPSQSAKALTNKKETVPNQVGKPIQNPTPKWLFQCMEGVDIVHLLSDNQINLTVVNVNALRRQIIQLFGPVAQKTYGFSGRSAECGILQLNRKWI